MPFYIFETELSVRGAPRRSAASRKNWARLIQKTYEVDKHLPSYDDMICDPIHPVEWYFS